MRFKKYYINPVILMIILLNYCFVLSAQEVKPDVKMNADKVDFDYETNESTFKGNVNISYGGVGLRADEAKISMTEKKGKASGKVLILNEEKVFFCDEVDYDFNKKNGVMVKGQTYDGGLIIKGEQIRQVEGKKIEIKNAQMFSCDSASPHFYLTATKVIIVSGKKIIAKNAVFWLGPVPFFYWPYYQRDLSEDSVFSFRLKKNDLFGFCLLTKYKFLSNNHSVAKLLLDSYEKRGVGIGVEGKTLYKDNETLYYSYFIQDKEFESNRSDEENGDLDRYMFSLNNSIKFSKDLKSTLKINVYSDLDFYDDFFTDEFEEDLQPDNRYKLSYSSEDFSAGMNVRIKLNDFHNVLERLPEFYYDLHQSKIGKSNFYFLTNNRASYLNQDFVDSATPEHDVFRFFSRSRLSYSKKYFGWLTFSPSYTLDSIWYSKSREEYQTESELSVYDPLTGETEVITQTNILEEDGSSVLRTGSNFSTTFSTSLYKVFEPENAVFGYTKYRHVLTPSFSYSYTPAASKDNSEIFQLDEKDNQSDEDQSSLNLYLISRWQVKDGLSAKTVLNTRYSISYDLEADDDPFGNLKYDTEIRFSRNLKMDLRCEYNIEEGELEYIREDLSWKYRSLLGFSLIYWYRNNEDNIISPEISMNLGNKLFARAYAHYNEETESFEKKNFSIIKSLHCLDLALTYSYRDFRDEKTIYFSLSSRNISAQGLSVTQ